MRTIKIGKNPANDFVVSDDTVSRQHAVVTITDDNKIVIRDLNSLNGTYVNGQRITIDTVVSNSDSIKLGAYNLNLSDVLNKTTVRTAANPNRKTIGRGNDQDIVLPFNDVSTGHAVLERDGMGEITITDRASTNGTFVNGKRVNHAILHKGDVVTVATHTVDWENYFTPVAGGKKTISPNRKKRLTTTITVTLVAILLIVGGCILYQNFYKWPTEKIYKTYSPAVCMVWEQYAYRVSFDVPDKEIVNYCYEILGLDEKTNIMVNAKDSTLQLSGSEIYTGTGFFISEDGKIVTNLHIVKPWLSEEHKFEQQKIEQRVHLILMRKAQELERNSIYYNDQSSALEATILKTAIPKIKVTGITLSLGIISNGLPFSEENLHECVMYKTPDDPQKDVAVIQVATHTLPTGVKQYVDLKRFQAKSNATQQGTGIHVIGFPISTFMALVNTSGEAEVIQNQIQSGEITQDRGDIEFGHNVATYGGASGSPVFNSYGQLVGVHHSGLSQAGVHGFSQAIKIQYVLDLLKK